MGAGTSFPHPWVKTIIALVAGAVLGYVSEMLAGSIGGRNGPRCSRRHSAGDIKNPEPALGSGFAFWQYGLLVGGLIQS